MSKGTYFQEILVTKEQLALDLLEAIRSGIRGKVFHGGTHSDVEDLNRVLSMLLDVKNALTPDPAPAPKTFREVNA